MLPVIREATVWIESRTRCAYPAMVCTCLRERRPDAAGQACITARAARRGTGIDETDDIDQYPSEASLPWRTAMAWVGGEKMRELEGVLHEAAGRLSPAHVAALVAHPDVVRSALAVVADVLTLDDEAGSGIETIAGAEPVRVGVEEAAGRMAERSRAGAPETLLTSDELAERVGLKTRQSVHDWLKKGRIVGWRGARRGHVFPAGQLDDRGRPVDGLDRVAGLFDDGYAAWVWLTTEQSSLDGGKPLTLLAGGEIDRVVNAAEGDRQGDFA